jgi:hypothetical protein
VLSFTLPLVVSGEPRVSASRYMFTWSCLMAAVLLATIWVVVRARAGLGLDVWPTALMLSPSILYFSLMRYDILCAFVLCLSLSAFLRHRYGVAQVLLAVGTFVKWYPALVFPAYLSYQFRHETGAGLRSLTWRGLKSLRVFLLSVAMLFAISIAFGTWQGFLSTYRFHLAQGSQYFNLYWMAEKAFSAASLADSPAWTAVTFLFLVLQFAGAIVAFWSVRGGEDVIRASVLAIYVFVTFSKIDSPQWMLWYLPPALMVVRQRVTIWAFAGATALNYLVFPLGYDALGPESFAFSAIVLMKDMALLVGIVLLLQETISTARPVRRTLPST